MAQDVSAALVDSLATIAETNTNVLKELKDLVKELKKILPGKKGALVDEAVKTEELESTDIALQSKVQQVTLSDIELPAYKKLKELFETSFGKTAPEPTKKTTEQVASSGGGGGLLGNIATKLLGKSGFGKALSSGLLSSLAGLGASLALAIGSCFNEGPWKGTMKLVGEIGTKVFLPKVTKILTQFFPKMFETFTKGIKGVGSSLAGSVTKLLPTTGLLGKLATKFLGFFTPLLKRLPVIGTIINIGSAISRFIKGDIIGGLIDLGSAVAVLIPGVGTAISLGLGLLNAGRDITGESKKPVGEQMGSVGKILGKALDWFKEKIKNVFNAWFGKIGRGIKQISSGDYIRGVVTLASFIPGFFWLESLYNMLAGAPKKTEEEAGKKETLPSDIVAKAWSWVKNKIKNIFTSYFGKLGRGWDQIKSGDYIRGVVTLASFIPGLFWLEPLYNWLVGPPEKSEEGSKKEKPEPNILSKAWSWMKNKFKSIFTSYFGKLSKGWDQIKAGNIVQGLVTLASFIPGFGWIESVYNWLASPSEKSQEEGKKEKTEPNILSKAWSWIKDKFKNIFTTYFGKLAKGWDQIKSGNIIQGLVTWASFIPGFGWLESLYNFIAKPIESPKDEAGGGDKFSFEPSKLFGSIKDAIKTKLKGIVESLKKLWWVPNKVVDKIASFLGLAEGKNATTDTAAVGTDKSTAAVGMGKSIDTTVSKIENVSPINTAAIVAPVTPTLTATAAQLTPEQQAIQQQRQSSEAAQAAFNNIQPTIPQSVSVPVVPSSGKSNQEIMNKMVEKINVLAKPSGSVSRTSSSNLVSNADNSSVNIYNSGSDRDIPYVERNKYRQQLLYIRGIL